MAIIAIDFDGTCVTHEYPNVGKDIGAVPVLKKLVENGHQLILWTMRSEMRGISPVTGKEEDGGLRASINWFKENNIPLYGIQTNPTQAKWTSSPKAYFQLCIDDANLGCPLITETYPNSVILQKSYVDWVKVEELLKQSGYIK